MEEILKHLDKTMLITVTSVLFSILIGLLGWIARHINKMQKTFMKEFTLLKIENASTDYAIGKSFGNGYEKDKLEKKKELMGDHDFTHKGK